MTTHYRRAAHYMEQVLTAYSPEALEERLAPKLEQPVARAFNGARINTETLARRWQPLAETVTLDSYQALVDPQTLAQMELYQHNIENFIGTVKVPVGLAGPLRVNGLFAQGDYYLPLATTEAALVASYSRGSQLISAAGGCTAMLLNEAVSRAPGFAFTNLREAGKFVVWVTTQMEEFKRQAAATTRYGQLLDMQITVEGNYVYLNFEFSTGDAAGQNMVTIATQAICYYIEAYSPVRPQYFFVEANLSGDKKASSHSFRSVRGKKVSAEVTLPASLVHERLHTGPQQMVDYWRMSAVGSVLSGAMGLQGHYANGLAALYLATGQDVACVAESAVGITRFEVTPQGELYASVTLPNLIVGTVGGGTGLPSQRACLEVLGFSHREASLAGPGHSTGRLHTAQALAEICAGLCLAGELSIAGAMCSGDFTRAHRLLARGEKGM